MGLCLFLQNALLDNYFVLKKQIPVIAINRALPCGMLVGVLLPLLEAVLELCVNNLHN